MVIGYKRGISLSGRWPKEDNKSQWSVATREEYVSVVIGYISTREIKATMVIDYKRISLSGHWLQKKKNYVSVVIGYKTRISLYGHWLQVRKSQWSLATRRE